MDLGSLCHSMFSALFATVLRLMRCLGPTFSEMELPPQDPQPSVSDGARLKLYRSPMPPWEDGVFIRIRAVFMRSPNSRTRAGCRSWSVYKTEVCPMPPSAT